MTVEPAGSPDPTAAHVPYGRLILAGIGAGAVVFGLGSRVAMRVVGLAASPNTSESRPPSASWGG